MKSRKNVILSVMWGLGVFLAMASSAGSVSAVTNTYNAIMDKAVYQGVYKCYKAGAIKKSFTDLSKQYAGASSLLTNKKTTKVALVTGAASSTVFSSAKYTTPSGTVSCSDLYTGSQLGKNNTNIFSASGKTPPDRNNASAVNKFMENMGFKVTTKNSNKTCYQVVYNGKVGGKVYKNRTSNAVCQDSSGNVAPDAVPKGASKNGSPEIVFKGSGGQICVHTIAADGNDTGSRGCETITGLTGEKLLSLAKKKACAGGSSATCSYEFTSSKKVNSAAGTSAKWITTKSVTEGKTAAYVPPALKAIRYFSGDNKYSTLNSIKVTEIEKRLLYQDYMTSYYKAKVDCTGNGSGNKINWMDTNTGKVSKCTYTSTGANSANAVNGISANGYFAKNSIAGPDALAGEINKLKTEYTEEELKELNDIKNSGLDSDNAGEGTDTCAGAGGAGTLGWVACPILEWMGNATEEVYNKYVEPSLQVSPTLFTGGNDATNVAWSTFRDMANIIFAILFLVVIFSQLTGVGIDNYGIKKILPKLIVVAVLINLSYLLCLMAVDVSNILGNGLQSLFNGMADRMQMPNNMVITTDQGETSIDTGTITGLTGVALLGGLVGGGVAIWASPAVLLSVLVAAIGVVISIFFLFILLAAREAAIVVLVVASPVAVVLYALPNTKKVFDKWLKAFEGLLLVYPICGLLVGGGAYVSKLLVVVGSQSGDNGFIAAFTAMIASIVPIFFIPTILRNSFSAIGNIGARISGFGQRVSRGAMRGVQGSGAFQAAQQGIAKADKVRMSGVTRNEDGSYTARKMNVFQRAIRGGSGNIARNRRELLSQIDAQNAEDRMMSGGFAASMAGMAAKARDAEISDRLMLMRGAGGGIQMDNEEQPRAFTLDNAADRLRQLEMNSRGRELTDNEQTEVAVLARGLSGMKGGASRMNDIVREAGARDANGNVALNRNFMQTMGNVYSQDGEVASAMNKKDGTIGSYMENFVPGGSGLQPDAQGNVSGQSYAAAAASGNLQDRAKSYEAKLSQGGTALRETIAGLSAEDCQAIYDQGAEKNLDADDFQAFKSHADQLGVTGKSTQAVRFDVGNNANANSSNSRSTGGRPPVPSGYTETDSGIVIPHR